MAYEDQRGPRCRNSWRPCDGPLSQEPEAVQQPRVAESPSSIPHQRSAYNWALYEKHSTRMTPAQSKPSAHTFNDSEHLPFVPQHSYTARSPQTAIHPQLQRGSHEKPLPQIWRQSIDDLIRRTAHDYDLVMNYERDAEGGQRWLSEDIAIIRDVGKNLHRDIFALMRRRRVIAGLGDQHSKDLMIQAKSAANLVSLLCKRVQRAISKYEQKCEFELLREGVYEQDEDGNFYKPSLAETDVQGFSYRNSRHEDGYRTERLYLQEQRQNQYSRRDDSKARPLPEFAISSQSADIQALDSAIQRSSSNEKEHGNALSQREAAHKLKPSCSDGAFDGKVRKFEEDEFSVRKRRAYSPPSRDDSLDSITYLPRIVSDKKSRTRGRNNKYDRDGRSRRQAKRDLEQNRLPIQIAGKLGKHVLHY